MIGRCQICGSGPCPEPGVCPERLRDARSQAAFDAALPWWFHAILIGGLAVVGVVMLSLALR